MTGDRVVHGVGERGVARHDEPRQQLVANGVRVVYGPFFVGGEPPAPGNLAFDADLRARHRDWGVRRLDDVVRAADRVGLAFEQRHDLPANNLALVFRLGGAAMTAQDDTSARRPAFQPFNPSAGPETQR